MFFSVDLFIFSSAPAAAIAIGLSDRFCFSSVCVYIGWHVRMHTHTHACGYIGWYVRMHTHTHTCLCLHRVACRAAEGAFPIKLSLSLSLSPSLSLSLARARARATQSMFCPRFVSIVFLFSCFFFFRQGVGGDDSDDEV